MAIHLMLDGEDCALEILNLKPTLRICIEGHAHEVQETPGADPACFELSIDGVRHEVWRVIDGERMHLRLGGRNFSVVLDDPLAPGRGGAGSDTVQASMPGVVVAVRVAEGEAVEAGQVLLVIESMKMQVALSAPRAGTVAKVHVAPNDTFQKGALLVALEAEITP
jgi:3-methylcrotonyl-CoA carboxylase alpha subunit